MLYERLRDEWHTRKRAAPIYPAMTFAPEGLVLGAGTVLLQAEGPRRLQSLRGQEARVLALLAAAYGKAVAPVVLGNIERAVRSWRDGDGCLAHIHLAHGGLRQPEDLRSAACRLFIAESAMKAGMSPRTIIQALKIDYLDVDAFKKLYNPAEPRVPAGSGRTSGQWTRGLSSLGELTPVAAEALGRFAVRLLFSRTSAAAKVLSGLLFIPSPNMVRVDGEVPGVAGLRYAWNRDETLLHLTYDNANGQRSIFTAQLEDDVFRDKNGRIVARILSGGNVVVDTAAVFPDAVNDDEPRLCPLPGLDKPGERGRDYADYVKTVVNPIDTTPRYWGFQLVNPTNGSQVYYDDCQHSTGMMVEAKGPGYAKLLQSPIINDSVKREFLEESARQIAALGTRRLRWYFAEPTVADFARDLFRTSGGGRERIDVRDLPWP